MARSIVENADLPHAIQWERLRSAYFARHGMTDKSKACSAIAEWFEARLDKVLEDHLSPDCKNSGAGQ